MALTTNVQGSFVSTGSNFSINLPSGCDWMTVQNLTQLAANQTTAVGVEYRWQNSDLFTPGSKIVHFKSNATNAANLDQFITSNGFTLVNTSANPLGTINNTITAISNASIPVVTNTGTNNLVPGAVVRLSNIAGGNQLGGIDFTVGQNTLSSTTFSLDYMPQIAAATTGSWAVVNFNPLFYPARRLITGITQASQAVVTMSVTHTYQVGQTVRINVPSIFGMTQISGLLGTIVDVNNSSTVNSITLNINSTGFNAFVFPVSSPNAFTFAEVIPVGEDTASALAFGTNILSDATINTGKIAMVLNGGANCPGGAVNDVMIWQAGVVFSNQDYA